MTESWWPIYRINFSKPQMWFLMEHIQELRNGDWPEKPGSYVEKPKYACKAAKEKNYYGLCVSCPHIPCLSPSDRTPARIRKERNINRVIEIAAEFDIRYGLVVEYMSGWQRPSDKIYKNGRKKDVTNSCVK